MKMKITDNEIIKALEKILELMCNEGDLQRSAIISKSLDLINRQKAEIERLKKENNQLAEDWSNVTIEKDLLFDEAKALIEKAKVETAKEFAEIVKANKHKLFNYIYSSKGFDEQIDNLLKEMVGEQRKEDEGK